MGGGDGWTGETRLVCYFLRHDSNEWSDLTLLLQSGTPYKGGKFKLSITFGADYPFKPPSVSEVLKVPLLYIHRGLILTVPLFIDPLQAKNLPSKRRFRWKVSSQHSHRFRGPGTLLTIAILHHFRSASALGCSRRRIGNRRRKCLQVSLPSKFFR